MVFLLLIRFFLFDLELNFLEIMLWREEARLKYIQQTTCQLLLSIV